MACYDVASNIRQALIDGCNDPMTGGLDAVGGKRKRATGPRRPAGTPHKLERARYERRKSLVAAGMRSAGETEVGSGMYCPPRRPTHFRPSFLESNGMASQDLASNVCPPRHPTHYKPSCLESGGIL